MGVQMCIRDRLEVIRNEEKNNTRGHLKIFFGYAAGVGKTYAMLKAAQAAKRHGTDVVAGYIEPHARPQTAALVHGLEVLPTLDIEYNGITPVSYTHLYHKEIFQPALFLTRRSSPCNPHARADNHAWQDGGLYSGCPAF